MITGFHVDLQLLKVMDYQYSARDIPPCAGHRTCPKSGARIYGQEESEG